MQFYATTYQCTIKMKIVFSFNGFSSVELIQVQSGLETKSLAITVLIKHVFNRLDALQVTEKQNKSIKGIQSSKANQEKSTELYSFMMHQWTPKGKAATVSFTWIQIYRTVTDRIRTDLATNSGQHPVHCRSTWR